MSLFNLERFRFDKNKPTSNQDKYSGSVSPESEKENKPAQVTTPVSDLGKPGRGVVFEDVISDSDDLASDSRSDKLTERVTEPVKESLKREVREMTETSDNEDKMDKELEERLAKLQEIFPQRDGKELLEVIKSTSTLDGAIASCLMFGDKDSTRKRKQDGSSSSQDSDVVQQPSKKRRPSLTEDTEEGAEPSWERREAMVRKLQRKFPDQDKEELRSVLQEHEWNVDDALEVLRMFSDPDEDSSAREVSSSPEVKQKELNAKSNGKAKSDAKPSRDRWESKDSKEEARRSNASALKWMFKKPAPEFRPYSSSSSSTSTSQKLSNGTSVAKKEASERKRKARASYERASSSEDEDTEGASSEFEGEDDELDFVAGDEGTSTLKDQILHFFQEASLDELSLIAGCSLKKAQKIVELRPFAVWQDLVSKRNLPI